MRRVRRVPGSLAESAPRARSAPAGLPRGARLLLACGAHFLLACGSMQTTQRMFHGEVVVGPYIEPEAYAAFAEGVYLEQRGDYERAARAYRRAQARDADSPDIAARLGAVVCRVSLEQALEEFHTSDIARDYAPAWAERALCLHRHGDGRGALEAARRAVMLDPYQEDANLLIADLLRERARPAEARAWLFAWALSDPDAAARGNELEARARLLGDRELAALARASVDQKRAAHDSGDDRANPSPARLALLAALRGEPEQAEREARLALAANPAHADALVIALFAASSRLDEPGFVELLAGARPHAPLGPEAAALMADLIRWRVGDDAATRWLEAYRRTVPEGAGPAPGGSGGAAGSARSGAFPDGDDAEP
jgi:tetratricopeptide (TPR) repeat protein